MRSTCALPARFDDGAFLGNGLMGAVFVLSSLVLIRVVNKLWTK
jgi:hypothetical protein